MPGPTISHLLDPPDYDTFYRIARRYSEEMLRRLRMLKLSGEVIALFAESIMDDDPADHLLLLQHIATELEKAAHQTGGEMVATFWPTRLSEVSSEQAFHQVYRQRWHPYDGPAWDALYADFAAWAGLRINALVQHVQQLRILSSERLPELRQKLSREDYRRIGQIALEAASRCEDLRAMIDAAAFDQWVAANW